ncbi:MAG: hypothetical protein MJZ94_05875 [Bacteroidales bacterium]|nr:hypothetical protein [Bacteroidales bacterium]
MKADEEIIKQVKEIITQDFTFLETKDIQSKAISQEKLEAIVISSNVLFVHVKQLMNITENQGKRFAAKIFKLYRQVIQVYAEQTNAIFEIYDSNSFLIIYPGQKEEARIAVKHAMHLTHILTETLKAYAEHFNQMNFSIGIDHGRILGTNEGRLVWRGICIEKAKLISELCIKPYRIGVSESVYRTLEEEDKSITKHILGIPKKEAIWERNSYDFHNVHKHLYTTRHSEVFNSQDDIV